MLFNKRFGRYRFVKKLATGGMAEVYLGLKSGPTVFGKLVALKTMLPHMQSDETLVRMFFNEARLGAQFSHPNLIHVFDADTIDDRHTMVMEFVPGQTVEELLERSIQRGVPIPPSVAMAIVSAAANGLHHAHEVRDLDGRSMNIVHRDISPQNVMVSFDGEVKIFDFGVAVAAQSGDNRQMAGKTAYMSPEQCRGRGVDRRSDVFSLGVVLHEMLTGRPLFKRENHMASIRAITEEPVPLPGALGVQLPEGVDEIVAMALSRDPAQRYASAWDFHRAIVEWQAASGELVESEHIASHMRELFDGEVSELQAVVDKILMAPEQSEATIDLSTFDVPTRTNTTRNAAILDDEGDGLRELGAPPLAGGGGAAASESAWSSQANAAMSEQLQRYRKLAIALGVTAALILVGGLAGVLVLAQKLKTTPTATAAADAPAAPTHVTVQVSSEPAGAAIVINGQPRPEVTPAELSFTVGQSARVEVRKDGYLPFVTELRPGATGQAPIAARLEIDESSEFAPIGRMRVVFTPENATVLIDGEVRGEKSPVVVDRLELNKEHILRLEAKGYESVYYPFKLDNREVLEVQLELPEAVDLGKVTVTSNPTGAAVFINGNEVGVTPFNDAELPSGVAYTIEVSKAGFARWRKVVNVQKGRAQTIDAQLEKPGAPRPASAAPSTGTASPAGGKPAQTAPKKEEEEYFLLE